MCSPSATLLLSVGFPFVDLQIDRISKHNLEFNLQLANYKE